MEGGVVENSAAERRKSHSLTAIAAVALAFLLVGSFLGYWMGYYSVAEELSQLENEISSLRGQITSGAVQLRLVPEGLEALVENSSLATLYEQVKDSIVVVRGLAMEYDIFGRRYYAQAQGSGFIYNYSGEMVVITNYHVVQNTVNVSVTFADGNGYAAELIGFDPYADLAVLRVDAPISEFKPLEVVSSSKLKVGDFVVAVGNPYGLAGSMSFGIVSALGRSLAGEQTGGYPIANVIQTTAPLNPGNSGGPLLNLEGQVVGVTTAIVSGSQGLGFAIPSNTILREIASLVENGSYDMHPWIGAAGVDMNYEIAKVMNVNVTYGWLIVDVVEDGPAAKAGLRGGTRQILIGDEPVTIGGDIIIAINGTRILGIDSLSAYLEENTKPGQNIEVTIVREGQILNVTLTLGKRPPLT
ncbi:trypsin-like peptidase domain-containing protein [Candidatus Bathyarchaeota archaeon]|nr:trypsin-like peptidase domain-containing protein [Candidatus Bathyarchaeota archaeon]